MAKSRWVPSGSTRSALLPAIRIRFSGVPPGVFCHFWPAGHRHHHVLHAQRVAGVVDPVVDLELDPGRGQEVQRTGRQEALAGEQLVADRDRVGVVEGVGPVVRSEVATERGAHGAHLRRREVVVAAVERARPAGLLGGGGGHPPRPGRRLPDVGVDQVLLAEHVAEPLEVQDRHPHRQPVPGHPAVHHGEGPPRRRAEDHVAPRDAGVPPGRSPDRRARVVDRLAGPVQVAQRAEGLGGVPRVEGQRVDAGPAGLRIRCGDVTLRNREDRDRFGRRDLLAATPRWCPRSVSTGGP